MRIAARLVAAAARSCPFRRRCAGGASGASTASTLVARVAAGLAGAYVAPALEQRARRRAARPVARRAAGGPRTLRLRRRGGRVAPGALARRRLHDRSDAARLRARRCAGPAARVEDAVVVAVTKTAALVGTPDRRLTPLDELYLQRAYELAGRGVGSTSPNPPGGRAGRARRCDRRRGLPSSRGRTRTPRSTRCGRRGPDARRDGVRLARAVRATWVGRRRARRALIEAGVTRVVAGALDPPNDGHGGADHLRDAGIDVDRRRRPPRARTDRGFERRNARAPVRGVEDGDVARRSDRDRGRACASSWDRRSEARYVRELRIAYDAVMVGAGTVRVDDPQLTVRPAHDRVRPYVRVVACETRNRSRRRAAMSRQRATDYAQTIVLAPAGLRERVRQRSRRSPTLRSSGARTTRRRSTCARR